MNYYSFTDIECAKYLEFLKLGGKQPSCILCGHNKTYKTSVAGNYKCPSCNRHFTVKSKTVFENTKIPLNKWFKTIYLVLSTSGKLSSVSLSKELTVTQKTAWGMLSKLQEIGFKVGVSFGKSKGINFPAIPKNNINFLFTKILLICLRKDDDYINNYTDNGHNFLASDSAATIVNYTSINTSRFYPSNNKSVSSEEVEPQVNKNKKSRKYYQLRDNFIL